MLRVRGRLETPLVASLGRCLDQCLYRPAATAIDPPGFGEIESRTDRSDHRLPALTDAGLSNRTLRILVARISADRHRLDHRWWVRQPELHHLSDPGL